MGKSEKVSHPPTITAVAVPEMIFSAPEVIPRLLEMQAIDTVWAGMLFGRPETAATTSSMNKTIKEIIETMKKDERRRRRMKRRRRN